ncbi:transcriptional regulator family: Fungal Specific TF [Penicillium waksmanii]|uniref:transcriptional regulator family: Fungal Specific TF n=1 Tax=Penicillium waksmanii TaxID=69791 RepID=UPI0025472BB8|nr:transcriptional regulator family: Fungal Specific TF [Penicillium waksmanii]KAJ5984611.1 transcriptional regulator family: Fungal Specific TF [Penicillium waksmanii]
MRQANYGSDATQMTLAMINNVNNDDLTLLPQQRGMIDLFMVLYGSFRWDDVAAKTRVRDRAVRVNPKNTNASKPTNKYSRNGCAFANALIQNTASWNFCVESMWVLDPHVPSSVQAEFWSIKDLPAGPRKQKVSKSFCTIPDGYSAGFGGGQAEAVTLTAEHTQGNPNWITFCGGTHIWYQPNNKAAALSNADFLENMIFNTPEILEHDFTHGKGQLGEYYGKEPIRPSPSLQKPTYISLTASANQLKGAGGTDREGGGWGIRGLR